MAARKRTRTEVTRVPIDSRPSTPSSRRAAVLGLSAILVLLTVAAYAPVWRFDFVAIDDPHYVYANPNLADGLSLASVAWAFTTGHAGNWHPLTWMSHALDIELFGLHAGGHHLTSLLLHLASTLLLFGVLRRMTGSIGRSAFVAAVFALHPLHVESVAWVAERKDVLSGCFFMLTLGAYARYADAPGRGRYLVVATCLALGLMAKAMLVTTPMVLLLMDWWPLGRVLQGPETLRAPRAQRSWGALLLEKLPLFVLVAISSVVTFLVQRQGGAVKDLATSPFALRAENAIVSYQNYLVDVVWPSALGNFYPFPTSIAGGRVAVSAIVILALTAAAVWVARRAPFVTVGWLWYLGMLVPVIGLVKVGGQARADRYMYLPIIGLAIATAWGAVALLRTDRLRRAAAAAGALVILASAVVTHAQVQYWRDTVAIWTRTAKVTEGTNNFGVYFGLGEHLRTKGRPAEAIAYYEAAIQRNPSYPDARFGLALALIELKQLARAAEVLEALVPLDPSSIDTRMTLGRVLLDLGRASDAAAHFAEAVRLQPDSAYAQSRLALALAAAGRLDDALPAFAAAVRLEPLSPSMRNDYGWALAQHDQPADALVQLREAVRLKPDLPDAQRNLGSVLAAQGQLAEALAHLSEAVRLAPRFVGARLTLAVALVRAGRLDDGAKEMHEVLRLDPQNATAQRMLAAIGR